MTKNILVTGASRGIGEQTALALAHALPSDENNEVINYGFQPAKPIITYLKHGERALQVASVIQRSRTDLDLNPLVFQMDITNPNSVVGLSRKLAPDYLNLDGAVFNVAGGLEGEGNDAVFSEDINHYGQVTLLGALGSVLKDEAVITFVQSHWGHLAGEVPPPPFEGYGTYVAEPKQRGEKALRERVERLADRGILFKVVTGGIVEDTPVGRRGIRNFPEWTARQRGIGNVIKAKEMGLAIARTVMSRESDPVVWVGADEATFRALSKELEGE